MIRVAAAVALMSVLTSCSLAGEQSGPSLAWRVEVESDAPLGSRGATDNDHFYAERGQSLAAYRIADGTLAWSAAISRFCTPPAVAAGRVFCPSDNLTALDAKTGRVLWSVTPDSTFQLVKGTADADRVYVGSLESVYAFDARTGALAWRRAVSGQGWTGAATRTLTLDGTTLFATVEALYSANRFFSASVIVAYDAASGRELWRFQDGDGTGSQKIGGLAVTPDALIYSDPEGEPQATVAIDRVTRAVRWRVERRPGFRGTRREPEIEDGVAYYAEGDERLYAVDVATGDVRWSVRPDRGSYRNHEVCGSYFVGDNTALSVVDRATGARVDMLLGRSDETVRQMAERNGRLFVATNRAVYAYDC